MRRLKTFVHVDGVAYGPTSKVPTAVASRIGEHAWEDDGEAAAEPSPAGGPPPRAGRGSSVDAWRSFAEAHGVEVGPDASREEIIVACETVGLIEPEQPKE